MNTFAFALQMEKDGIEYYKKQSVCVQDPKAKKIFQMLSEDETRHYKMIYKMLDEKKVEYQDTESFKYIKNIFYDLKEANECFTLEKSFLEVLLEAIKKEKEAVNLYKKIESENSTKEEKKLLKNLIKEEKKHTAILENMHAFLSKPETWVESAEFNHLDEY